MTWAEPLPGTITLLVAPGLTTRNKKLLVTKGIATRNKDAIVSFAKIGKSWISNLPMQCPCAYFVEVYM